MKLAVQLLTTGLLFVAWGGVTFYLGVWLYFAPVRWPAMAGTMQSVLLIILIVGSLMSYAIVLDWLLKKVKL